MGLESRIKRAESIFNQGREHRSLQLDPRHVAVLDEAAVLKATEGLDGGFATLWESAIAQAVMSGALSEEEAPDLRRAIMETLGK